MEITPRELEALLVGIINCGDRSEQPFRANMVNNLEIIQEAIKSRNKGKETPKKWDEFSDRRRVLIDTYSSSQKEDGSPDFGKNEDVFADKFTELKVEYADMFLEKAKIDREFEEKVMQRNIEVNLMLTDISDIPEDLTIGQHLGISKLIKK